MEYIGLADQLNATIRLIRTDLPDWNNSTVWKWSPSADQGFFDCEKFINVSDIKVRNSAYYGGKVMLTCASLGFGAIVGYPDGKAIWSLKNSDLNNPHAVELLPDGNFCIASSEGNSVRVYAASQGIGCGYAEAFLEDAHGLLWDPQREILWALAGSALTAYRISGTSAKPEIMELTEKRTTLPTVHGHDLSPVYGNPDRLWVTTGSGVYQFDKSKLTWVSYHKEEQISCPTAKSIGNQPISGNIIRCVPNGTQYSWNTDTLDFFIWNPDGSYTHQTKVFQSGAFYKARVWCEDYQ